VSADIRHGFVCERVQHVTLKSMANNLGIKEGMTCQQIDEAIKTARGLRDAVRQAVRGQEDGRLTGPCTVEIAVKVIRDYRDEVIKVFNV
jgi:adenine-specific DNA-methyltransferase